MINDLKKQIIDIFEDSNIKIGLYFTGSYARNEIRTSNFSSDIDILVVLEDVNDYKIVKKEIDKAMKNFAFVSEVSFIYALKSVLEKNYLSNLVLSTNFYEPILEKIKVNIKMDRDSNLYLNNQLQCIGYYFSKFQYFQDNLSLYKALLHILKTRIFINTKQIMTSFFDIKNSKDIYKFISYDNLKEFISYFEKGDSKANINYLFYEAINNLSLLLDNLKKIEFRIELSSVNLIFKTLTIPDIFCRSADYPKIFKIVQKENMGLTKSVIDY